VSLASVSAALSAVSPGGAAEQAQVRVSPQAGYPDPTTTHHQLTVRPAVPGTTFTSSGPETANSPQFAPFIAQSIEAANDGTNTVVNQTGDGFDITGGQQSGDLSNLFHSFEQFNLSPEEVANFLTQPEVQNILSRVVGGDPSVLNGLMQVLGSNANLYLINPAGIVVGPEAQFNVPAALTLSTANAVGFGDEWWQTDGLNDYQALNGNPDAFGFATDQPGIILNSGQIAVDNGQSISLLGGTVVNTGQISAPGGNITITAVPGESILRLSQPGQLLSLDLDTSTLPATGVVPIISLPELLTGSGLDLGLAASTSGQVQLTETGTVIPTATGDAIAAGTLDVANPSGQGGTVAITGDRVGLVGATVNATGTTGGGRALIGGSYQGQGEIPNASRTLVDGNSTINASALESGDGGEIIVWADDTTGFFGNLLARGGELSGNGGFAEVSGKETLIFRGTADLSAPQGDFGSLLLDPENITIISGSPGSDDGQLSPDVPTLGDPAGQILAGDGGSSSFTISEITLESLAGTANVELQALNNITVADLTDNELTFADGPGGTITFTADADNSGQGDFLMEDTNDTIRALGRDVRISGNNLVLGNIDTSSDSRGPGGDVTLTARGDVQGGTIRTSSFFDGGNVNVSGNNLVLGDIDASSDSVGDGGNVALNGQSNVQTGIINTSSQYADGGNVTLSAGEDVQVTAINAQGGRERSYSYYSEGGYSEGGYSEGYYASNPATSQGGTVDITAARFFRATGTFSDQNDINASISTAAVQGGAITIRHGGGPLETPFTIGSDYTNINGTRGAITTGVDNTIAQGSFPQTFGQGTSPAEIQLITEEPITEIPDPGIDTPDPPPETPPPQALAPNTQAPIRTLEEAEQILRDIEDATGIKPALVYLQFVPANLAAGSGSGQAEASNKAVQSLANQDAKAGSDLVEVVNRDPASGFSQQEQRYTQSYEAFLQLPGESTQTPVSRQSDDDQLELLIITADGPPIWRRLGVTRQQMLSTVQTFRLEVADPRKVWTNSYQPYAQQLYDWIIAPIQQELTEREIGNLTFLADEGLRSVPWAALQNDGQFLIEQYSVGLMPSLSLVDTRFVDVRGAQVLAAGASTFENQSPLPAVPVELNLLNTLWEGKVLAEEEFTLDTLRQQQQELPFGIVHLATHGEFKPGDPENSYIQLKDDRLRMDQLRQMGWSDPPLELLVLSACRTALGDAEAELGFAGLAIQAGVKSALASLWYVSDVGTLALMTEFYRQLQEAPDPTLKAEALRLAQLEILNQNVTFTPAGLQLPGMDTPIPLDLELSGTDVGSLQHPYFWAAFTLTGNPW